MNITKEVSPRFEDFLFEWDYNKYLLVGGYGSGKSYHVALKLIMLGLSEKRKILVVRNTYESLRDSCYSLIVEILESMDLVAETPRSKKRCVVSLSPLRVRFPNGSIMIFKGMDKPWKLKSINDVSAVWLEEASEIKYAGYKELLGRLRHPTLELYFFLTTNPVGTENWIYQHFFIHTNEQGQQEVILDDEVLYRMHTVVKKGVYYHHSLATDNAFLPVSYTKQLDEMAEYDPDLFRVARLGRFGVNGLKVLPQFQIVPHSIVNSFYNKTERKFHFTGFDFGFETSFNAIIRVAVDDVEKDLYIFDEFYKNHMTDNKTALEMHDLGYEGELITADCEDPKAIQFYRDEGFYIKGCKKYKNSRLANTRKIKRFRHIYCSEKCINVIRELRDLTYAKDSKDLPILDQFNIDPHTFSAIWYALDKYNVANLKERVNNSRR